MEWGVMNIPKHPDSYGLKTRDCLSILTAVVLEQSPFPGAVSVRVRARVRALLSGCVSHSLTLSLHSTVLWPGKCLRFGFPALRAMANKLLLLSHSPNPSPKASLGPGMLCQGWQGFLTDEQKEQLCLLPWLWNLMLLLFLRCISRCSPGGDMTLFAASRDVRITHTSAVPHAPSCPRQLHMSTGAHQQLHPHRRVSSLSSPRFSPCQQQHNPSSPYTRIHSTNNNPGTCRRPQGHGVFCALYMREMRGLN